MPAANDADGSIVLIECSTTDPLDSKRVDKLLAWFDPGGIVVAQLEALTAVDPSRARPVVVALFYDVLLKVRDSEANKSAARLDAAASQHCAAVGAPRAVAVRVVDAPSLDLPLGVSL